MTGLLFLLEYSVGASAEERNLTSKVDHSPAQYEGVCFFKSEPPFSQTSHGQLGKSVCTIRGFPTKIVQVVLSSGEN